MAEAPAICVPRRQTLLSRSQRSPSVCWVPRPRRGLVQAQSGARVPDLPWLPRWLLGACPRGLPWAPGAPRSVWTLQGQVPTENWPSLAAGLAEKAVRDASAVWRRKCGLIIDPRLLSSNATSDPAGGREKAAERISAACSHLLHGRLPLSSCAAAVCHKEQVLAVLCSVYSFGAPSHKSCPAINDKNHWYA